MIAIAATVDWERAGGGGSAAQIVRRGELALKQGHDRAGRAKIDDERRWLHWVAATQPMALRRCFVPVVDGACGPGRLAMPWIDGTNARALALDGVVDRPLLHHAVHQAAVALFRSELARAGDGVARWWSAQLGHRLRLAQQRGRYVRDLATAPTVLMVDRTVRNPVHPGFEPIVDLLRHHPPPAVGPIHGDLHLGNLIVTAEGGGLWVDPRGRFGEGRHFDVAYDVAKLLHEPHYVAARARVVRTRLRLAGDQLVAVPLRSATAEDQRRLQPLTAASLSLATDVCRHQALEDPSVAARATLYTGLLFLTVLPFQVLTEGEWESLLLSGLRWLSAGRHVLDHGLGVEDCVRPWRRLVADLVPVDPDVVAEAMAEGVPSLAR